MSNLSAIAANVNQKMGYETAGSVAMKPAETAGSIAFGGGETAGSVAAAPSSAPSTGGGNSCGGSFSATA